MSFYSYKRVRELIPQHLADKYQKEWAEEHESADGKEFRIEQLIWIGNSPERAEEIYNSDEWFWDNEYNGDLFDAAADYIAELQAKLDSVSKSEPVAWLDPETGLCTRFPPELANKFLEAAWKPLYTSPQVPEGFVMVPLEPTDAMILAGCHHNQNLVKALIEIRDAPDRPHRTCPGYECWFASRIWDAAQKHYAEMSGPACAEAIRRNGTFCEDME